MKALTMKPMKLALAIAAVTALLGTASIVTASSHREAPGITKTPKADNTDLYMFRSYEAGQSGSVTILANYQPLQDAYGGPNYFLMDDKVVYDIHIDNNGDGASDITYEFRFVNQFKNLAIPVNGVQVPVPLSNIGPFTQANTAALNVIQNYSVTVRTPNSSSVAVNPFGRTNFYPKPFDNIGTKSIANYGNYADQHIGLLSYNGCAGAGKTFVGQRKEGFSVALGEVFDLVNLNPVGPPNAERNDLYDKNVTTIAIEVPISCLTNGSETVIGAWAGAHVMNNDGTTGAGVSRLGMPLVNEVVIGLPDKDKFNASRPLDDAQFANYVTNPTLPELLEILFGVTAPNKFPRTDLVAAFLTGIAGLNQPANVVPSEMLRLNTAIAPKPAAMQSNLGVLGSDTAGFPNGRRPGDDVVDITLRVAMGVLLTDAEAPSRNLPYTDGASVSASEFRNTFPYLNTPIGGDIDI
ncbi:MAG: DUF4331 domain-containing protein [Pseudomonadota bacterium]